MSAELPAHVPPILPPPPLPPRVQAPPRIEPALRPILIPRQAPPRSQPSRFRPLWAIPLSWAFPGLGQLWLGQAHKAVAFAVLGGLGFLAALASPVSGPAAIPGWFLWLYVANLGDAIWSACRAVQRRPQR